MSSFFFHLFMLSVVLALLCIVWRDERLGFVKFAGLSLCGALAVPLLVLVVTKTNGQCFVAGFCWHGSFFLLGSAAILLARFRRARPRKRIVIPCVVLGLPLLFIGINGLLIEPTALRVLRHTVVSSKLKKPVRIVFLTDIQTDRIGAYEKRTLRLAAAQQADLIVLGGDYLQPEVLEKRSLQRLMRDFNALFLNAALRAPLGVFAIQGNHEHYSPYRWREYFPPEIGIVAIDRTRSFTAEETGLRLTLLSAGDSFRPSLRLEENKEGYFHVLIGHSPNFFMGRNDADLLLAGHTHGGQVQIPGFGPLLTLTKGVPRRWCSGITQRPNGKTLIVSNGSGMERGRAPRLRLFCRPDIVVVDCRPAS